MDPQNPHDEVSPKPHGAPEQAPQIGSMPTSEQAGEPPADAAGYAPPPIGDDASAPLRPQTRPAPDLSLEAEIEAALGSLSVEDLLDSSPKRVPLHRTTGGRQLRSGRVMQVRDGDVLVEFGPKSQGVCPVAQFEAPPEPGTEMEFMVERLDPFENVLILSRPGAVTRAEWGTLDIGQVVEARCVGVNRGGLEMEVAHHRAFMPAAHIDIRHIEDTSTLIGEKFPCMIIELKKERGRMVLSRRKVLERERDEKRKELLDSLKPGQRVSATIVSVQPYGAFADLGGIDGLIPIGQLAYEHIKHPSEVVTPGDVVELKVLRVEKAGKNSKVTLSRKGLMVDPVVTALESISAGSTVQGRVARYMEFGVLVELAPGLEGLVHATEITHERVHNPIHALKINETINVKVLSVDRKNRRVSLSVKALKDPPPRTDARGGRDQRGPRESDKPGERAVDPAMKKLLAKFGGNRELKGGIM
jgi:ribosomal protein S1